MIIHIDFSEEITTIIQSSKHYNDAKSRFTLDQMSDIVLFAQYYSIEKHLQFFKNEENILYGFCYGKQYGSTYWMFLDENYVFYDIQFRNNVRLSQAKRLELGDICETVEKLRLQYFDDVDTTETKSWWYWIHSKNIVKYLP